MSELGGGIKHAYFKNKSLSADLSDVTKKFSSANKKISALTESIKIAWSRERDAKKQAKISEEDAMTWKAQYKMLLREGKETKQQQLVEIESKMQETIQQSNEKMDRALEKAEVSISALF